MWNILPPSHLPFILVFCFFLCLFTTLNWIKWRSIRSHNKYPLDPSFLWGMVIRFVGTAVLGGSIGSKYRNSTDNLGRLRVVLKCNIKIASFSNAFILPFFFYLTTICTTFILICCFSVALGRLVSYKGSKGRLIIVDFHAFTWPYTWLLWLKKKKKVILKVLFSGSCNPTIFFFFFLENLQILGERLNGPFDIEAVVDPIGVKISDAIMNFQNSGVEVTEKVFQDCGNPRVQKRQVNKHSFGVRIFSSHVILEMDNKSPFRFIICFCYKHSRQRMEPVDLTEAAALHQYPEECPQSPRRTPSSRSWLRRSGSRWKRPKASGRSCLTDCVRMTQLGRDQVSSLSQRFTFPYFITRTVSDSSV